MLTFLNGELLTSRILFTRIGDSPVVTRALRSGAPLVNVTLKDPPTAVSILYQQVSFTQTHRRSALTVTRGLRATRLGTAEVINTRGVNRL